MNLKFTKVNPKWHVGCMKRIVLPHVGPVMVVCDTCLCICSLADTYLGQENDEQLYEAGLVSPVAVPS